MGFVVLTETEEDENLHRIVSVLNDDRSPQDEWNGRSYPSEDAIWLRRMVRAWRDADSDPTKMVFGAGDIDRLTKYIKSIGVSFDMNSSARWLVDYYPAKGGDHDPAALQFTRLMCNKQSNKLGGPCPAVTRGDACLKWWIRSKGGVGIYCPKPASCAGQAAKTAERGRNRKKKLELAQAAIKNYESSKHAKYRCMDWKDYVIKAIENECEAIMRDDEMEPISKSFLTRAVVSGELTPPEPWAAPPWPTLIG